MIGHNWRHLPKDTKDFYRRKAEAINHAYLRSLAVQILPTVAASQFKGEKANHPRTVTKDEGNASRGNGLHNARPTKNKGHILPTTTSDEIHEDALMRVQDCKYYFIIVILLNVNI